MNKKMQYKLQNKNSNNPTKYFFLKLNKLKRNQIATSKIKLFNKKNCKTMKIKIS